MAHFKITFTSMDRDAAYVVMEQDADHLSRELYGNICKEMQWLASIADLHDLSATITRDGSYIGIIGMFYNWADAVYYYSLHGFSRKGCDKEPHRFQKRAA